MSVVYAMLDESSGLLSGITVGERVVNHNALLNARPGDYEQLLKSSAFIGAFVSFESTDEYRTVLNAERDVVAKFGMDKLYETGHLQYMQRGHAKRGRLPVRMDWRDLLMPKHLMGPPTA